MEQLNKEKYFRAMARIEAIKASIETTKKSYVNIRRHALSILEYDGFNVKDKGTQYLASLITLYFHERKFYEKVGERKTYEGYWDLDKLSNEHYKMLGNKPTEVVKEILIAIEKNEMEDCMIDDLVYDLTDSLIHAYDRDYVFDNDKEFIRYTKLLKK